MAANRLARWALLVHQYDYTVEYRRSKNHGNADALSRLPFSNDTSFDGEEMEDDVDSVCLVRTISRQINPDNPLLVVRDCQGSNSCPSNAICEGGMAACIFGRA